LVAEVKEFGTMVKPLVLKKIPLGLRRKTKKGPIHGMKTYQGGPKGGVLTKEEFEKKGGDKGPRGPPKLRTPQKRGPPAGEREENGNS